MTVEKNYQLTQLLSPQVIAQIDSWIVKYPVNQRQSAVMQALMFAQEANGGHLTQQLMDAIAEYLAMPAIAVYEVATFYSMYHLEPTGKYQINVCTNISCKLRGADSVVEYLERNLGIKLGGTTKDGKFTLRGVECLAACAGAPMLQLNKDYHENLDPAKIDKLLEGCQ